MFTVRVRSVPRYHFKLAYVILQMAVKNSSKPISENGDTNLVHDNSSFAEAHHHHIDSQQISLKEHASKLSDLVTKQSDLCYTWTSGNIVDIKSTSKIIDSFLVEELKEDIPTGLTPQRKSYTYPRSLTRTNPHDELILNYRRTHGLPLENLDESIEYEENEDTRKSIPTMNLDNSFESSQASEMFDETPLKENKKTKKGKGPLTSTVDKENIHGTNDIQVSSKLPSGKIRTQSEVSRQPLKSANVN